MDKRGLEFLKLRRAYLRTILAGCIGAAAGLMAKLEFGWSPTDFVHLVLDRPTALIFGHSIPQNVDLILNYVSGPVAGTFIAIAAASTGIGRSVLSKIIPDPLDFLRSDLEQERKRTMTLMERAAPEFLGRDNEIEHLLNFATNDNASYRWTSVIGPTGIGKTRLAIEWLDALSRMGWDIGFVKHSTTLEDRLNKWHPQKHTALVLDEAERTWGTALPRILNALGAAARSRRHVRVLVVNQVEPPAARTNDADVRAFVENAETTPPLRVAELNKVAAHVLWQTSGGSGLSVDDVHRQLGGRPRAILLLAHESPGTTYIEALAAWAESLVPGLADAPGEAAEFTNRNLVKLLCLAALAGPLPLDAARSLTEGVFDKQPLRRFFVDTTFELELPALEPEDLGQEILLRGLAFLDVQERRSILQTALSANAIAVENVLTALWTERPERLNAIRVFNNLPAEGNVAEIERAKIIVEIQRAFDQSDPERSYEILHSIEALAVQTKEIAGAPANSTPILLQNTLSSVSKLASSRSFDNNVRLQEVRAVFNATLAFATWSRDIEVYFWASRFFALIESEQLSANLDAQRRGATVALKAITCSALANDFDALERWGAKLIALAGRSTFLSDYEVRECAVVAALNAVISYGNAKLFGDLDRWVTSLISLTEARPFSDNAKLRVYEVNGIGSVVNSYGETQQFDEMEKWYAKLVQFGDDPRFVDILEIRREVAGGVLAAMTRYIEAKRSNDVERVGEQFVLLISEPKLLADLEIRRMEALAAANAMVDCGRNGSFVKLEYWGKRLEAIVAVPEFATDIDILSKEVGAAGNAILFYGESGRADDLDRWGARLIATAENPLFSNCLEIRRCEAIGAMNAMYGYGKSERFDDLEIWGSRLITIAHSSPFSNDAEVRFNEVGGVVNAISTYGQSERFDEMERWGEYLNELIANPIVLNDAGMRLRVAMGVTDALLSYEKASLTGSERHHKWLLCLAKYAREFPHDVEIQNRATTFQVTYAEQALSNWPFGK